MLSATQLEGLNDWENLNYEPLCPDNCVPAATQGILTLECRMDDEEVFELLRGISDLETEQMALAERQFLALAQENSAFETGALAQKFDESWYFTAFLAKSATDVGRKIRLTGENPLMLALQAYEKLAQ